MERIEEKELVKFFLPDNSEEIFDYVVQFNELMLKYNSAIREVKTKLEILNDELSINNQTSPIESIHARTKKPISIAQKLKRMHKDATLDAIVDNLNDVAGIRVICPFVDDIYKVAEMLVKQDDIQVIEIKDYIKDPKPNGYRSYHMIVEVPVFFSDYKQMMRVELQIRTVAMDFWASLEHRLKYKKDIADAGQIAAELSECAEVIARTDQKMLEIRQRIDQD
ncbi:GTP pyrophosphokinase [Paenibacillus marinisediminis]